MNTVRPVQILTVTITPKTHGDHTLIRALDRLRIEDPTICVPWSDSETGRVTIAALGPTHLEIIVDRLRREFGVEGAISPPGVFLRTAIFNSALGESKYLRTIRGQAQYAHVKLQLTPRADGEGYSFENQLLGRTIPPRFIPAIRHGVDTARKIAMGTGHPIDDVRVELVDGSYHDVDSSESAFRIAATQAFFYGALKARPTVVEPLMRVEATFSLEYATELMQSLFRRGARVLMQRDDGDRRTIVALVQALQTIGLASDISTITQDSGIYSVRFDHYEPVSDERDRGDKDRDSLVGAPRKPISPDRMSAIALPEPEDDDHDDDPSLPM